MKTYEIGWQEQVTHQNPKSNMALEYDTGWVQDRGKALRALERAKEVNARKTVPIKINDKLTIYVTPEQAEDEKYLARLFSNYL